jgi:hypothetical protein
MITFAISPPTFAFGGPNSFPPFCLVSQWKLIGLMKMRNGNGLTDVQKKKERIKLLGIET